MDQQDLSENTDEILDDVEVCQKFDITMQDLSYGLTTYTDLKDCDSFIVELSPDCPGVNPGAFTREIPKTDFNWMEDNNSLTFEHTENSLGFVYAENWDYITVCNLSGSRCTKTDYCGEIRYWCYGDQCYN